MQITAQAQFARNLARWQELLTDRELARLPHRIETDRLGRIIMTPLPSLTHGTPQFGIQKLAQSKADVAFIPASVGRNPTLSALASARFESKSRIDGRSS